MSTSQIHQSKRLTQAAARDMGVGFGRFADEVLRGRENKLILNSSIGLAALEAGIPANVNSLGDLDIGKMVINNSKFFGSSNSLADHPLFPTEQYPYMFFGFDFQDVWRQFAGEPSMHHAPIFKADGTGIDGQSLAQTIGLPDLPYGEMAHFGHMAMAFYDTGRTFQDLWNEPALKHNVLKVATHPDFVHTLAHRAVMLTVMGLLHPLGPAIAIGVSYICAHMVHSFFSLLEDNKTAFKAMDDYPVLHQIYQYTGIKEWAEAKASINPHSTNEMNPIDDTPGDEKPKNRIHEVTKHKSSNHALGINH